MDKVKRIQVGDQVYEFADYDLFELLADSNNHNKIIKIDENGGLSIENTGVAECNGVYYESLRAAIEATETGFIKLLNEIVLDEQLKITDGKTLTIDFNGHSIRAGKDLTLESDLINVEYGASLTFDGIGGVYAGSKTYSAVGTCVKGAAGSEKISQLIINNGTFEGKYYAVSSEGSKSENYSNIQINGGTFRTLDRKDGIALYNPAYNSTVTISDGEFIGATALEVRAGEVEISGGHFVGLAPFTIVANGSGGTSTGCALTIAQHVSKQPISVNVTGGLFEGEYSFYEANPQKNSQADIDQVTVKLTNGAFKNAIYSEDKTQFINSNCLIPADTSEAYKA